jgi:hypothetical protein
MNSSRSYRIGSLRHCAAARLRSFAFAKAGTYASEHKQPMNLDTNTFDPGGGASA